MPLQKITSAANPRFKRLRSLTDARGVRRHEQALVSGRRLVRELLADPPAAGACLIQSSDTAEPHALPPGVDALVLAPALFRQLDTLGTGPPLLIVPAARPPAWDAPRESGGLSVVLPLGDPENLGAAIRCAAAFSADRVVLLEEAANPFTPRALRASAGTCFRVDLRSGPSLTTLTADPPGSVEWLALDRAGDPLADLPGPPPRGRALLVGEEGGGLPPGGGALRRVSIPISRDVDSLNAAVAIGIALYELRRSEEAAP